MTSDESIVHWGGELLQALEGCNSWTQNEVVVQKNIACGTEVREEGRKKKRMRQTWSEGQNYKCVYKL